MASPIRALVEDVARKVDSDPKFRDSLKRWFSTYDGKIVGFRIGGSIDRSEWRERFHLILSRDGARVEEGDYPSPELTLLIERDEDAAEMFRSPGKTMEMIRGGRVWVMGNMNEALPFFNEVVARCSDVAKKHLPPS